MTTECVPAILDVNISVIHAKSVLQDHVCIRLEELCKPGSGCAGNLKITGSVDFPGRVSYVAGTCSLDGEGNDSSDDDDDYDDDDDDMASLPAICRPSAQLPCLLHRLILHAEASPPLRACSLSVKGVGACCGFDDHVQNVHVKACRCCHYQSLNLL